GRLRQRRAWREVLLLRCLKGSRTTILARRKPNRRIPCTPCPAQDWQYTSTPKVGRSKAPLCIGATEGRRARSGGTDRRSRWCRQGRLDLEPDRAGDGGPTAQLDVARSRSNPQRTPIDAEPL